MAIRKSVSAVVVKQMWCIPLGGLIQAVLLSPPSPVRSSPILSNPLQPVAPPTTMEADVNSADAVGSQAREEVDLQWN